MIACSTEKLFFINNSPTLLKPSGTKPLYAAPIPSDIASFWNPPSLGISVALRGGTFSGTIHYYKNLREQ